MMILLFDVKTTRKKMESLWLSEWGTFLSL